jgi:hypothetical protein
MIRIIFKDSQNKQDRINRLAELLLSKSNTASISKNSPDIPKKDALGKKLQDE